MSLYYQILENCCAKVSNGKQGTAFFITPQLAITCAHVIPDELIKGDFITLTPYGSTTQKAQILDLSRDTHEDYCILLTEAFSAESFVILNHKNDFLNQGCKLFGFGFPALDTPRLESFDGTYVGPIIPGNAGQYPFPSHKIKDGQIKPGLSGSPVINVRTGRCIGVVSKTFDQHASLGGWVISADLYLSRLEHLKKYWPFDNSVMAAKWQKAAKEYHQQESIATDASPVVPYDEAYTCDRVAFSGNYKAFQKYSSEKGLQVNHLLITGKSIHSPAGLARKLIYENIVRKTAPPFYPNNPEIPSGRSIKLKVDYTTTSEDFLRELRLLYIGDPAEKAALLDLNQAQLYQDLVRNFNENEYNLHIVKVEFPTSRHQQAELFKFLKEFTGLLEEKTQMIRTKVFFFWCFEHAGFMVDDGTLSILPGVVIRKNLTRSTKWYLLSLIPFISQLALRFEMKKLGPGDYFIWPVNQANLLRKPPEDYIRTWVKDINAGRCIIGEARIKKILSLKHTDEIEDELLKIIEESRRPQHNLTES